MVRAAALLALLFAGSPAIAQTPAVDSARLAGAVGERYDGYLGLAAIVPPQVRSQVAAINIKRRSLYTNLATRKGASRREVGVTAGCELLGRVAVGEAYMLIDGAWRRRAPDQPAPAPDYCR